MSTQTPFRAWAIVEIFGHERIAGEVSEENIVGATFVRIDVPDSPGYSGFTRYFGPAAIYSITPVEEALARQAAAGMRVRPVNVYLLPVLSTSALDESAEPQKPAGPPDWERGEDDGDTHD